MIANWIHIIIVHLSILGTPLLAYYVFVHRKSPMDDAKWKNNFTASIVLATITTVAYFTGSETADWTKEVLVEYSQDRVENHALWGRISFAIQGIIGLLGVMGWSSILKEEVPDPRIYKIIFALLIINSLVLFYTAHLGGAIRRSDLIQ